MFLLLLIRIVCLAEAASGKAIVGGTDNAATQQLLHMIDEWSALTLPFVPNWERNDVTPVATSKRRYPRCEHVELIDCSDYVTDEMTCMVTATGMTCCICTAPLKEGSGR